MKKRVIFSVILIVSLTSFASFADSTWDDLAREHKIAIEAKSNTIRLIAIGDIMMHMPVVNNAVEGESYSFVSYFEHVEEIFGKGDIVIGNLETTLTDKFRELSGYPKFKSPYSLAFDLKKVGIDFLITSNNHSLDARVEGLDDTIKFLDQTELGHTGTFENENINPSILKIKKLTVGISSYTYGTNGLRSNNDFNVNYIDKEKIINDSKYLDDSGVDLKIIYLHWGDEYKNKINDLQIEIEKLVRELGYNVVLGSHPHVLQKEEHSYNYFVIYSMGNFLSNQRDKYTDLGVIVDLSIEKYNNKIYVRINQLIPTWVDKYDSNNKIDYKIIPLNTNKYEKFSRISVSDKKHIDKIMMYFNKIYDIK